MKFPSISLIGQSLGTAFQRYFLCVLVSIIATICAFMLIETTHKASYNIIPIELKIILVSSLAMPLFFSVHTLFEQGKKYISAGLLVGGLILIGVFYLGLEVRFDNPSRSLYRYFIWSTVFHLIVAFSAFYEPDKINGFWQWNKSLFLRFLLASLSSAVLYLGLAGAIVAVENLFGVHVDERNYARLAVLITSLFHPIFFLSGIPSSIEALQTENTYPKALKIFAQYILLSLVLVYMVILYAYTGKIIINWSLPKGWVCHLVLWFSVTGVLSLLLLYPLVNQEENKWLIWVNRLYYILIIPLVVLMFISINVRITQYGITPNRFIIILLAIWLGLIALYFSFTKKDNIIIIPMSLAVISLIFSFGPWGMFAISTNSQTKRVMPILEKFQLIKEGKLQKISDKTALDEKSRMKIASFFDYVRDMQEENKIRDWFPSDWQKDSVFFKSGGLNTLVLGEKLGFSVEPYSAYTENDTSNSEYAPTINANTKFTLANGIQIQGFDKIINFTACAKTLAKGEYCYNDGLAAKGEIDNQQMAITIDENTFGNVDLKGLIEKLQNWKSVDNYSDTYPNENELILEETGKFKMIPTSIRFKRFRKGVEIQEITGFLLLVSK